MPQQTILDDLTVGETLAIADALCRRGSTDRAFTLLASALATLPDRTDIRVRKGIAAAPTRRTGMMLDIMAALASIGGEHGVGRSGPRASSRMGWPRG